MTAKRRLRSGNLPAFDARTLALSLVLFAMPVGGAAACLGHDPADAAKAFFTQHRSFYRGNPDKVAGLVASRLYAALSAEYRCARGEVCAIDAEPWTDAQDGDIAQPISFRVRSASVTRAEVAVGYIFELSPADRMQQTVSLRLERRDGAGCWRIADLVSPRGRSLVKTLEAWHARYGAGSRSE